MATLNPLEKFTVRISPLLILFFLSITSPTASSRSPAKISYSRYCNSVIKEPISDGHEVESLDFLQLKGGYFKGGQKFLSTQTPDSVRNFQKLVRFNTNSLSKTGTDGVFKIQATLSFYDNGRAYAIFRNSSTDKRGRPRGQRTFYYGGEAIVSFQLQGFWTESAGKLCMVGTGYGLSEGGDYIKLSAVTKLNYPKRSDINTSIVTGTVESVDSEESSSYFNPISILGFSQKKYSYSLASEAEGKCGGGDPSGEKLLGLEPGKSICSRLSPLARSNFQLNYGSDCSAGKCSPFDGFKPEFMYFRGVLCSEGKMRMFLGFSLGFSNSSYRRFRNEVPLIPETGLVAEGVWDEEKNQLCVVGCRLKNFGGSLAETLVGDCSVGLSLTLPKVWSIKVRSPAVGSIWSLRKANESGYFDRIEFWSLSHRRSVSDLTYNYTELDRAKNSCTKRRKSRDRFPDGSSFEDMRFDMSLDTSNKSRMSWASATPLSIDQVFYDPNTPVVLTSIEDSSSITEPNISPPPSHSNRSLRNVSYSIVISSWDGHRVMQIAAEGIYDAETGILCMVGCRSLGVDGGIKAKGIGLDCEILINIDLAPFNSEAGKRLNGTIRSTREKKDALFFDQFGLSSNDIYLLEAAETVSRMDLEIAMVLISLTLACVFIGLQLYYVKKNPDVLPSISIVMLVILTLGHMIPLVLNFEAFFFRNRSRQNIMLWSGGWLEANEVIVRVVTMVAFLLQFRLLQLNFSARLAESSKKNLWVAEKKATRVSLLLYLVGGLLAWLVHSKKFKNAAWMVTSVAHSGWEDLKSFAGLVLDGFLLPQILLNLFCDSKDRALAPSYYFGTTAVRSLPHAYDAYRAHWSPRYVMNSTFIYADPGWDLYSTAWDVIIPCGGLLLAFLIFLQQRFGGAFILPRRFRRSAEYEKVPVISG